MFNFNVKKAPIYIAIKREKFPLFKFARPLKFLFLILFLLCFFVFSYGFFPQKLPSGIVRIFLGLSFIFLSLFIFFQVLESFFNQKIKNPSLKAKIGDAVLDPEKYNLAEFLGFEAAKAVNKAIRATRNSGIDSLHVFYFLLVDNPVLNFVFARSFLRMSDVKRELKEAVKKYQSPAAGEAFTSAFQKTILDALQYAKDRNNLRVKKTDLLSALAKNDEFFKKVLMNAKLKPEDIENLSFWLEDVEEAAEKRKRFWEYEKLAKNGTLAKEWVAGYTITLDKYSKDLTELVKGDSPEFVSHQKEVKAVERILAKRERNNALIVGESGSGRRSVVLGLAQRSLLGKSLPGVNYKRVVELDVAALLAQQKSTEELEETLNRILNDAVTAGNIILLIDNIHNYIGQETKPGIIDISGALTPFLRLPNFQIIGITNYEGLHRDIERNSALLSLFEKVEVAVISKEETLRILESLVPILEKKNKIIISYLALRDIVDLTDRYLSNLTFPEKAMQILDEAAVYVAANTKDKILLPKHVAKLITEKTEIPVGDIEARERKVLLNLENLIHQRIINQDEAVNDVSTAMRRARADITIRKGPIGAFLFLGPTGVGKTETSKALAEFYFGSEKRMIRLDMSEFQEVKDISRLIGSPSETGLLVMPVRETPFSLLLLDEIEKANPNILNLFLQVLDEGYLTDGLGRKVDFKNTIIIATSNAGYQIILEAIKQQSEWSGVKPRLLDYLFQEQIFRPEFINRFDAVVVFRPLSKENLLGIAQLLLANLKKNLEEKGIGFKITEPLKERIVELGYNPTFGAREMRRVIQDKVENVLATALLSGKLTRGQSAEIDPEDFSLIVNPHTKRV